VGCAVEEKNGVPRSQAKRKGLVQVHAFAAEVRGHARFWSQRGGSGYDPTGGRIDGPDRVG